MKERVDLACGCWGFHWYGAKTIRYMKLCDRHVAAELDAGRRAERMRQRRDRNSRTSARLMEWMCGGVWAKGLPTLMRGAELAGQRVHYREALAAGDVTDWKIKTVAGLERG